MAMCKAKRRQHYEEILDHRPVETSRTIFGIVTIGTVATLIFIGSISLIFQLPRDSVLTQTQLSKQDAVIRIANGQILGRKFMKSRDGRSFLGFEGVPYAKPPVGGRRFALPIAIDSWNDILDATRVKPQCIQLYKDKASGNVSAVGLEDCLYLNIYTPKTLRELRLRNAKSNPFPVIFYLHGGVNNGNASQYLPDYFMDEDVVLVHVHFRLHVFGKLSTADGVASGNWALKDQVLALKWVRKNIHAFGGDKDRVTMYGISFGAMTGSAHLFSPMSKGLFHQLILQSGSLFYPRTIVRSSTNQKLTEELAKVMNCPITNSTALLFCLRQCDAASLTLAVRKIDFKFVVESTLEKSHLKHIFIPDEPLELLRSGNFVNVPSIQGVASAEELNAAIFELRKAELANLSSVEFANMNNSYFAGILTLTSTSALDIARKCQEFYFDQNKLTNRDIVLKNLTNLLSDRNWIHPLHTLVGFQLHSNTSFPVYLYYFTQESQHSYSNSKKKEWGESSIPFGVQHADDIQYYFPSGKFPKIKPGSEFYNFSKKLVNMWVNFATTGHPTKPEDELRWEANTFSTRSPATQFYKWLEFRKLFLMTKLNALETRMKFWDTFSKSELYV